MAAPLAGVVRRGGPAPPLVCVGCSWTFDRQHTFPDHPQVDAETPAWILKYVIHFYYLFLFLYGSNCVK
jgi:hypothetical protein